ncbi:hypothetical protein [Vibrio gallicus]|uniref:hypothetical protein n=1 Tax=Vibrio gallicus TaxID=190897 RepID=UPI0021C2E9CE|nr:hypothetical protein [Vibrio gallicus]
MNTTLNKNVTDLGEMSITIKTDSLSDLLWYITETVIFKTDTKLHINSLSVCHEENKAYFDLGYCDNSAVFIISDFYEHTIKDMVKEAYEQLSY